MKTSILLLAVALLSACIPVDDWGVYWAKGSIDPALLGTWEPVNRLDRSPGDKGLVIISQGDTYQIDSVEVKERQKKNYAPLFARSLKVGNYMFLMAGAKAHDGGLMRYAIKDGELTQYDLNAKAMSDYFLKAKFPQARNIGMKCDSDCRSASVKIGTFDDEVFQILSEIPDTKATWEVVGQYKKKP